MIEISPALLFNKEEYAEHGKHTILDHYTFKWPDGRMALALGLGACRVTMFSMIEIQHCKTIVGSLFNHSDTPNVSFSLDTSTESIRYTTSRTVNTDEELCIFYGHKLWFDPVSVPVGSTSTTTGTDDRPTSPPPSRSPSQSSLSSVSPLPSTTVNGPTYPTVRNPFSSDDPSSLLPESDLPFARTRVIPEDDDKEDTEGSIKTSKYFTLFSFTAASGLPLVGPDFHYSVIFRPLCLLLQLIAQR